MSNSESLPPVAGQSFEQALAELREIVQQLDAGDIPLEKAIERFSRGEELRAHCEAKLASAEEKLLKVVGDGVENLGDTN